MCKYKYIIEFSFIIIGNIFLIGFHCYFPTFVTRNYTYTYDKLLSAGNVIHDRINNGDAGFL